MLSDVSGVPIPRCEACGMGAGERCEDHDVEAPCGAHGVVAARDETVDMIQRLVNALCEAVILAARTGNITAARDWGNLLADIQAERNAPDA